jgi:anti-sigma factor RsiW
MSQCDQSILNAYVDGELDARVRERIERHLFDCPACAREVASLRELSALFRTEPFEDITPAELSRVHHAIEDDADAPIFRLGGVVGLIAASILIIAAAWIMELPGQKAPNRLHSHTTASARPASWETVAMTLRVEPPFPAQDADRIELADAMLHGLTPVHP